MVNMPCKHFPVYLALLLVISTVMFSCDSLVIPDLSSGVKGLEELMRGKDEEMEKPTSPKMQCYYNGIFYEGRIPSTSSCNEFFICAPSNNNGTAQNLILCPEGPGGSRLVYDFRKCGSSEGCNFKNEAECYDENNESHLNDFYKCATPYVPTHDNTRQMTQRR